MMKSSDSRLLIALLLAFLVSPSSALAAVIIVADACTLVDAITAANTDTATGGCPAGSGADEIKLTVDVTLTAVNNPTDGPNGLPSVISEMAIRSSDGTWRTIERSADALDFRILHIGEGATLNLEKVVVSNGLIPSQIDGGGIFNRGQLTLTDSRVSGNTSDDQAGGIMNKNQLTLTNSTVSGNSASDDGGGIFNSTPGSVTLTDSTVSGNSASKGGGIWNEGQLSLTNSTVSDNDTSGHHGGGIVNYFATATLTNSTVSGNSGFVGGGIYNEHATVSLTNSTVSNNSASFQGGGI